MKTYIVDTTYRLTKWGQMAGCYDDEGRLIAGGRPIVTKFQFTELREHDGTLFVTSFIHLNKFHPKSDILFPNPIFGNQYVDLMEQFNRAGDYHELAEIIRGEREPNGQLCEVYRINGEFTPLHHTFCIVYDNIFDIQFKLEDGTVYRDINKLVAPQRAIGHNEGVKQTKSKKEG